MLDFKKINFIYAKWNRRNAARRYIENPIEKVQLKAYSIACIENATEKVQLTSVRKSGYAIAYIKNPSEKVQLAAVKSESKAIEFIKKPCKQALEIAKNYTSWHRYGF